MYRHLFIEGPVRVGKSTMLRHMLKPYVNILGGFCSQRLLDNNGTPKGYRLTSPDQLAVDAIYDETLSGIFLKHCSRVTEKDFKIFETIGCHLLEISKKKKLILLDEIGGIELLSPKFYNKLEETLKGSIPCIGIIKLIENATRMDSFLNWDSNNSIEVSNYNLRNLITNETHGKIIPFDNNTEEEISQFLNDNIKEFIK